ncbi:MAG: enoyl-CoA hydratase/isomerase family protein [Actinomycetota bacterium]|nr:enoyl-CoA hydratase/isomerase family protein [Actinomycetota bacterium]
MDEESPHYEHLIYEEDGDTARVTLNRPEVVNALSMVLSDELFDAIRRVLDSTDLKFMVIKGAGGNFCAGDDITEMHLWGDANDVMRRARHYQNMANHLEELNKMTISAVDGYAVGGGLEITMACDFVIATERARWGMPEVDVGITPGWGAPPAWHASSITRARPVRWGIPRQGRRATTAGVSDGHRARCLSPHESVAGEEWLSGGGGPREPRQSEFNVLKESGSG